MENVTTPTPNPTIAMFWFFIVTTSFFVFRSFITENKFMYYFGIYLFLLIVGELRINIGVTRVMCKGTAQYRTATMATIIPYVIIFGSINILLKLFPSWLQPFSNTFGYLFTKGRSSTIINELFESSETPDKFQKTLENLYKDTSLLFNEFSTKNDVDDFMNKMQTISKTDNKKIPILREELSNLVSTKNSISEYIWYILTGGLVTSASFNYIVNSKCNYSVQDMQESNKDYLKSFEEKEKKKKEESDDAKKYKIYE